MSSWQCTARHRTREWELQLVMKELASFASPFDLILEIGSGECFSAFHLSAIGTVYPSDLRKPLAWYLPAERFVLCDAGNLPYRDKTFDLIFSSHVIEHIVDKAKAFSEMKRVAKDSALFIHIVPTHFWKLLSVLTYYPDQMLAAFRLISHSGQRPDICPSNNIFRPKKHFSISRFVPAIHGTNRSTWIEIQEFRPVTWLGLFTKAGFVCVKSTPLLAYSPSNMPILPANRFLVRFNLFSSIAYFCRTHSSY